MQHYVNIERLLEFEKRFLTELTESKVKILSDIPVSFQETQELGILIGSLIDADYLISLEKNMPLSISLFLVWCSVYNYKEGELWAPIVANLRLKNTPANLTSWLGELFLATLRSYNLQESPTEKRKKYMTAILMHGYISNHYAPQFFNYLNAIYSSYLEYELSPKALDYLWVDIFNLDQEQLAIRETVTKLHLDEQELRQQLENLGIPKIVQNDSSEQIERWHEEIQTLSNAIQDYEVELESSITLLQELQKLSREFNECAFALENIHKRNQLGSAALELVKPIQVGFNREIEMIQKNINETIRRNKTAKNNRAILQSKRSELMSEIVKWGQGSLVRGYELLQEYNRILTRLEAVRTQRLKREKFLEENHDLGNSTMRQVMTTSLTSLASVNPSLFQSFIETTLQQLDALYLGKTLDKSNRIYQPLMNWHKRRREQPEKPSRHAIASARERSVTAEAQTIGVRQIRLTAPRLQYSDEQKQLVLNFPEQNLPRSKKQHNAPQFYLENRKKPSKSVLSSHRFAEKRLLINSMTIPISDQNCTGLSFAWHNLYEYWDIGLDSIMIFTEHGRRLTGSSFPNGFYYLLTTTYWEIVPTNVIDSYPCLTDGYLVHEVYVVEGRLELASLDGASVCLSFSRYTDFELEEITWIPGLKQGGLHVATGNPALVFNRGFLAKTDDDLTLVLHHNGAKSVDMPFHLVLERYIKQDNQETSRLNLADLIGHKFRPNWQIIKISLIAVDKEVIFHREFCLVQCLQLCLEQELLRVEIPNKCRLKSTLDFSRDDRNYLFPLDNGELTFEIFYPRIGWKSFQVSIPTGSLQLLNQEGGLIDYPTQILKSERAVLNNIFVQFEANPQTVEEVLVFDQLMSLQMAFSLAQGRKSIPLGNFVELADWDEENIIFIQCQGKLGRGKKQPLIYTYPTISLENVEFYTSEQDDEYLLELNFITNYSKFDKLRFRVRSRDSQGEILLNRPIRSVPDVFYLHKKSLQDLIIYAEVYFTEEIRSIFGHHSKEQICWSKEIVLPNRKTLLARAQKEDLLLKSFQYNDAWYKLPTKYVISDISLNSKHFEGEEILTGYVDLEETKEEVFFYLEEEMTIPGLWDLDDDGVQYDPREQTLFWEVRKGAYIMGPLENLKFTFIKTFYVKLKDKVYFWET